MKKILAALVVLAFAAPVFAADEAKPADAAAAPAAKPAKKEKKAKKAKKAEKKAAAEEKKQ